VSSTNSTRRTTTRDGPTSAASTPEVDEVVVTDGHVGVPECGGDVASEGRHRDLLAVRDHRHRYGEAHPDDVAVLHRTRRRRVDPRIAVEQVGHPGRVEDVADRRQHRGDLRATPPSTSTATVMARSTVITCPSATSVSASGVTTSAVASSTPSWSSTTSTVAVGAIGSRSTAPSARTSTSTARSIAITSPSSTGVSKRRVDEVGLVQLDLDLVEDPRDGVGGGPHLQALPVDGDLHLGDGGQRQRHPGAQDGEGEQHESR
jgi:hypothetical protein